jgi:hypothetical protein
MALAKLSIDIVAKLAEFERDLGKAAHASDKAAEQIRKSFDGLKDYASSFAMGLGAGIAGALAGGALASLITESIDAAEELDRLSQSTGVSVEKLSQWGAVAKRNGLDVGDLAEQINELQAKLSEVDKDTEGAGYALKQLGIDYNELKKLTSEEAFEKVAQGLAKVEDSGAKAAMAMAIGGDEYQKYIAVLNDIGAGGLEAAAITAEQATQAANYKDSLAKLSVAGESWAQAVVGGIVPALDEAARALIDVMSGTEGMTAEARKLARDGTIVEWARGGVVALTYLIDAGIYTGKVLSSIAKTAAAAAVQVVQSMAGIGDVAGRVLAGDFTGAVNAAGAAVTRVQAVGQAWADDMSESWSERTLGAKIRDRIDDIKTMGAETVRASRPTKVAYDLVGSKAAAKAAEDAGKASAAARKKAADAAAKENERALAEYEKLITSIRAKTEADAAEINGTAAATEAQKMALEVMTQVRDGRLKLTDAQKGNVSTYLEELLTTERLLAAKRQQIEIDAQTIEATQGVRDTMRSRTEALQEQIKTARLEGEEVGLSTKAVLALRDARELDKAAALEQRAEITAALEDGAAMASIYRDQAAAIRELVQTQSNNRAGAESARRDPLAGARAGLEAYREQVSNTAADVQGAVGSIAGGLEDAMLGAFSGSADGAKRLFETIKAEALKLLVIRPIMQQLAGIGGGNVFGALAGAVGSMFGGVGSIGNAGAGNYSAAGMAAAFGRAGGGAVSAGSLHKVNERGPELVTTGGSDYLMMGGSGGFVTPVTPASAGGSSRGPVSITYAPQIQIDSRADRAQIMQDVAALNRRGQEEMMQTLKERGVV